MRPAERRWLKSEIDRRRRVIVSKSERADRSVTRFINERIEGREHARPMVRQ